MTDIEVIEKVNKSTKPKDIFNGDWKSTYKTYCRLIHPDICKHPDAADAKRNQSIKPTRAFV